AAKKLNGLAPGYLAAIAKELQIPINPPLQKGGAGAVFVNFSSDYVFDGERKEGYKEGDCPNPISKYGQTKLIGEREVAEVGGKYYIIRLQKLFGRPSSSQAAKKSFFEIILDLAKTKESLDLVDEELSNFTYAPDLAKQIKYLVENNLPFGIYHITNEGAPQTWYGAAKILFEMVGNIKIKLNPVSSDKFPRPAKRPKYTILINTKLPPLRPWPEALKEFLKQRIL
ncbi:MAG: NAD(P)-dependent oxidoreductase, partial [Candidatus Portnoybacteria bacterium]|nr:NAD(P)-dependent oxidoreductase [Candidatus Portnoybacteria bacterium]